MLHLKYLVAACVLALTVSQANAVTYNVLGTFEDGAFLTGSINLNPDNGLLLSVDLHGNNVMPGDPAVNWVGRPLTCDGCNGPTLFGPTFFWVTENYDPATQAYNFSFSGDGVVAHLNLAFTLLDHAGVITGGGVYDPACGSGPQCPFFVNGKKYTYGGGVNLTGGTLTGAPLPAALPLFATGLGVMGLLAWRRNRKQAAIPA
jgi:hypothetical protein